jgi:hypothetical protein
VDQLLII